MLDGTQSGCINHPGIEARARCKQCGKPVCGACIVAGPTGKFCSDACKETNQQFLVRAQQLEGKGGTALFTKLKGLIASLVIVAAVCIALGVVATVFEIPVLSGLVVKARGIIGF
jgi:hypothetical protein